MLQQLVRQQSGVEVVHGEVVSNPTIVMMRRDRFTSGAQDYPDVEFVTVMTAIRATPDAGAFMADHGITMPTAIDDTRGSLPSAFEIQGFATLYFVGSDGTVSTMAEGEVDEDALRGMIDGLT